MTDARCTRVIARTRRRGHSSLRPLDASGRFPAAAALLDSPEAAGPPLAYAPWVVSNLRVAAPPAGTAWDNVAYDAAAADGAPAAYGDLSRASLGFVVSTHQRRFRGNCLDALRRPRPAVTTAESPPRRR